MPVRVKSFGKRESRNAVRQIRCREASTPDVPLSASLAGVLSRLISDPERRRQLGDAAAARAATRFGWSTCADRYLMLAREISARDA